MKRISVILGITVGLLGLTTVFASDLKTLSAGFAAPVVSNPSSVPYPARGEIIYSDDDSTFYGNSDGTPSGWMPLGANSSLPAGTILPYVGVTAPPGFILCNGASYSATTYPTLANALWDSNTSKYAFGGSGTYPSGSFNVPDLRGRFLRGVDGSAARDPNSSARTAMATGGNTGNNVGSIQSDAFQGHWHNIEAGSGTTGANNMAAYSGAWSGPYPAATNSAFKATGVITDGTNGTPRISSETRPLNINVNYIIKI